MWYAASLLFKSVHDNAASGKSPLWEESIVVVNTGSEEAARQHAERLGKAKEHEYVSATGETVRWTFERVESVYAILDESIASGTEVFSRFLRDTEVESMLSPLVD